MIRQIVLQLLSLAIGINGEYQEDESPSINFVAIGDWGASLHDKIDRKGQSAVAKGMASYLEQVSHHNPFILSLGDNYYPAGVKDSQDMAHRFEESLNKVYHQNVYQDIDWYVIAGNHDYGYDHEGGFVQEADITFQMSFHSDSRWNFPYFYYKVERTLGNMKVQILMIDTVQLMGWNFTSSNVADRGQDFISHHLKNSDADYLIVAGHYPSSNVPHLTETLQGHGVSAYIHGHEHCQQYWVENDFHHIGSGAGCKISCDDSIGGDEDTGGFLSFRATPNVLVATFHNQNGEEIKQVHIKPRKQQDHEGTVAIL